MDEKQKDHHVAWADRIGLNKVWAKNILNCNESFGTDNYTNAVRGLFNSLINIKNGPELRKEVEDFKNNDLERWKKKVLNDWISENPKKASNRGALHQKIEDIGNASYEILYYYIVQTLENYNFCFYESNIEEDEISLNP